MKNEKKNGKIKNKKYFFFSSSERFIDDVILQHYSIFRFFLRMHELTSLTFFFFQSNHILQKKKITLRRSNQPHATCYILLYCLTQRNTLFCYTVHVLSPMLKLRVALDVTRQHTML
jgi:hypothetical protein